MKELPGMPQLSRRGSIAAVAINDDMDGNHGLEVWSLRPSPHRVWGALPEVCEYAGARYVNVDLIDELTVKAHCGADWRFPANAPTIPFAVHRSGGRWRLSETGDRSTMRSSGRRLSISADDGR
jgi:hypothetical protein